MERADSGERLIVGAMSGTSADGVDVALVRVSGRGLAMQAELVRHHHRAYDATMRDSIFAMRSSGSIKLVDLAQLGRSITLAYAAATNELLKLACVNASDIAAIAAHGQTLYHDPPNTIQWFDPSLLAAETNVAVVSDFRRADCAAGGQGAPLVPFADYILFRHPTKNRVLLNIGGIANVTYLRAGGSIDDIIAFDTGPGNCVMDYLCRKHFPSGPGFDADGMLSRRGQPIRAVLEELLTTVPYFRAKPPKSTDGPAMIAHFESLPKARNAPALDQIATALVFTVSSIQQAIAGHLGPVDELIVSGGGVRNDALMHHLRVGYKVAEAVMIAEDVGVSPDAKEAIAFALLGAATVDGEASNVPSATGAKRRVVLGSITPKP